MPWNGSGTFNRTNGVYSGAEVWKQSAAAGRNVRADDADTHDEDLATGLENCLTRDGQNRPSADLPMGGRKHTGVGDAEARDQYAALGQIQDGRPQIILASGVGGTADAITLAPSPAITAYARGQRFTFQVEAASMADVTINISGLGAKDLYMQGTNRAGAGDLKVGDFVTVLYNGTAFVVIGLPLGTAAQRSVGTATGDLAALGDNGTFPPDMIPGLTTDHIPDLDASKITSGAFAAARIPGINADKITDGTLAAARIPNLNADKIAEGTLDGARLPTDHLAVGSYARLLNATTTAHTEGSDYAGSSNLRSGVQPTGGWIYSQASYALPLTVGSAAPGTWRCMGSPVSGRVPDNGTHFFYGLYLRIS